MRIKKYFVLLLCLILFTSCSDKNVVQEPEKPIEEPGNIEDNKVFSTAWDMNMGAFDVNVPYEVPEFIPAAEKYQVDADLSNLVNAGQYTGFTDEQIKSIYEDGFVVLKPSYTALKMHHIYEFPMYRDSPVFITVDSALHLYHIYYGNTLKLLEVSSLYEKLENLTGNMLAESLKVYSNSEHKDLNEELKFVTAYFLTGAKLMDVDIEGIEIPDEIMMMRAICS